MKTPEQAQLLRWIKDRYDLDQIEQAEPVTRNALRLRLRDGKDYILILRQTGRIDRLNSKDLCLSD